MAKRKTAKQDSLPLTEAQKAEPITKANYRLRALKFNQELGDNATWYKLEPKTDQFHSWHQYFAKHLDWVPWEMAEMVAGSRKELTVPAEWPVNFDTSFREDERWKPRQPLPSYIPDDLGVTEHMREHGSPTSRVFVPDGHPLAQHFEARAADEPTRAFRGHRLVRGSDKTFIDGLWVPLDWVEKRGGSTTNQMIDAYQYAYDQNKQNGGDAT